MQVVLLKVKARKRRPLDFAPLRRHCATLARIVTSTTLPPSLSCHLPPSRLKPAAVSPRVPIDLPTVMNPQISLPRHGGPSSNFGGTVPSNRRQGIKMPRFFKRLFKFPQMDFETAVWEMMSLIIAPKKVFRSIYYHVSPLARATSRRHDNARDQPANQLRRNVYSQNLSPPPAHADRHLQKQRTHGTGLTPPSPTCSRSS